MSAGAGGLGCIGGSSSGRRTAVMLSASATGITNAPSAFTPWCRSTHISSSTTTHTETDTASAGAMWREAARAWLAERGKG